MLRVELKQLFTITILGIVFQTVKRLCTAFFKTTINLLSCKIILGIGGRISVKLDGDFQDLYDSNIF